MSTKFSRKPPPLTKSPIRTRPTRAVRSATSVSLQTPPGSGSMRKSTVLIRGQGAKKMDMKPEFDSFSCNMRALAQMVTGKTEIKAEQIRVRLSPVGLNSSPLFERGRFYDLYSAKRNERLKRRLGIELEDESVKKCFGKYDLGVMASGTMKRRDSKRLESGRKCLPVDLKSQPPRYSLRSSKDNMKPILSMSLDRSDGVNDVGGKRIGSARRVVRKI